LLKKASDPHKALLDYRNTEIPDIELSPAQIFFGRRLRTLLPTAAPLLNAHNRQGIRKMLMEWQHMQTHYYDQHSKQLEPLENGQTVLIHNGEKWAKYATVQRKHHNPRSYIHVVRTDDGQLYLRNRRHLRPTNAYQQHEPQEHQVGHQMHYRNPQHYKIMCDESFNVQGNICECFFMFIIKIAEYYKSQISDAIEIM
jgi:hypothetical protein